jgi:hypothetical protein
LHVAILGVAIAASGCGGGAKDAGTGGKIRVKGTFGAGITLASHGLHRGLASLGPATAVAAGDTIDNVVAADAGGHFILAEKSGNGFTLSLPAGRIYLVAFLSGMTAKAIYRADPSASGSGWIALPVGAGSSDVDLGTLTFDATGVGTGSTPATTIATDLGVDAGVQSALAVWDAAMQRLANVDVDGDGVFDFEQDRQYDFSLHYEFTPSPVFTALQGSGTFSDKTATTYLGYGYYFHAFPAGAYDWSTATLTSPAAITPYSVRTNPCWYQPSGGGETVNFFCGSGTVPANIAISPAQPPAGTYVVRASDGVTTTDFTFRNVASQLIDDVNLYNLYVPSVKLTMSGATVASIDLVWWKNTADGWVQPSAQELSAIMAWAGWELGQSGWQGDPSTTRVSGNLDIAPTATATAPFQSFTPGALRVGYRDAFGYSYGFEWR